MDKEVKKVLEMEPYVLKSVSVGFNEDEFLLLLNHFEQNSESGYAVTMPAGVMKQIVDVFIKSGKEYQNRFNKDIGF